MEPYGAYGVSKAGLNMRPGAPAEPDAVVPIVRALVALDASGPTGCCFDKRGNEIPWTAPDFKSGSSGRSSNLRGAMSRGARLGATDREATMNETTPPDLIAARRPTAYSLRTAIKEGRTADAVETLRRLPPVHRAELFVQLKPGDQKSVLGAAPPELTAEILADSDSARLVDALSSTDPASLGPAFARIPPDNLADLILRLPKPHAERFLEVLDPRRATKCVV